MTATPTPVAPAGAARAKTLAPGAAASKAPAARSKRAETVRELLGAPTARAARAVALMLLDDVDAARTQLDTAGPEALHDFRVALRRLRSWIRAYRKELKDSVGGKARKRISSLAETTTESRDLEVHLEWLANEEQACTERQLVGVRWLEERLRAEKSRADAAFHEELSVKYTELSGGLRKNLARYAVAVWDHDAHDRWATSAATHLNDAFSTFRRRLGAIEDENDDAGAHRARIAGKRLRYLLEPFVGVFDGADDCVERLKKVQDLLGAEHDAHVFAKAIHRAERVAAAGKPKVAGKAKPANGDGTQPVVQQADAKPGLRALRQRLTKRRHKSYRQFTSEWMERDFDVVAERVHTIMLALRERSGEGIEIERKYLLRRVPTEARRVKPADIDQGYVPGEKVLERLRRIRTPDGVRYYRTIKLGEGIVRTELEEEATRVMFSTMWPLTKGKRVRKQRYTLADAGRVWEIDRFLDRKLVLAEVELSSAEEEVVLPEWLARCTIREVTGEPEYANASLAR